MLKVGMVGVGCISGIYLKNFFETFKDVKLVAVCDLIRERAEKAKEEWGVEKIYDTMDELFADPEIDIVLNLTRPYQHYDVSKAALLAGKHVYSEKPLGADLAEGEELVKIAAEKGLLIGGAPDTFMGAGIQTCRKLIDEGLIGTPIGGRLVMASHGVETWHPDPDFYYQRGGGPLFDMGPYYLTALINMLGGIKKVMGYSHTAYDTRLITAEPHVGEIIEVNTPTHIEAFITLDSGITVSLLTSFDVYQSKQTNIEIYGTKGTLYVPDPNMFSGDIVFYNGETGETETYPVEFDYAENSRCLGLDDLAKAIETGRPGRTTSKQTFHVLETMAGIMKSAETGEPYVLTSHFDREAPMDPTLEHGVL
ncbi:MAG: Gfo/Idh/MocA family oxidoreductase [Oscillospiraceae bacterium]|nr:Gfo/Idh/MocA family oxidoreductase [Oscillospiraceae bacterium]